MNRPVSLNRHAFMLRQGGRTVSVPVIDGERVQHYVLGFEDRRIARKVHGILVETSRIQKSLNSTQQPNHMWVHRSNFYNVTDDVEEALRAFNVPGITPGVDVTLSTMSRLHVPKVGFGVRVGIGIGVGVGVSRDSNSKPRVKSSKSRKATTKKESVQHQEMMMQRPSRRKPSESRGADIAMVSIPLDELFMMPFDRNLGILLPYDVLEDSPEEAVLACNIVDPADDAPSLARSLSAAYYQDFDI